MSDSSASASRRQTGRGIKLYRIDRGLTQFDIADSLGVSRSTYSAWELTGNVEDSVLERIAEILETTPEQLRNGSEPKAAPENPYREKREEARLRGELLIKGMQRIRQTRHMSLTALAAALGIARSTLLVWINKNAIPEARLPDVCDALNTTVEELLAAGRTPDNFVPKLHQRSNSNNLSSWDKYTALSAADKHIIDNIIDHYYELSNIKKENADQHPMMQ